jgi:integrase
MLAPDSATVPAPTYSATRRWEGKAADDLWPQIFNDSPLANVTPHVLRHSFASIANDLGFTEITIAALVGHAKGSVTSKYIHTRDTALIMAADKISD